MGKRAAAPRGAGRSRVRRSAAPRRRALAPLLALGACLAALSVGGGAALAHWQGDRSAVEVAVGPDEPHDPPLTSPEASRDPRPGAGPESDSGPEPSVSASRLREPRPSPSSRPSASSTPSTSPSPSEKPADVPVSGAGTFTVAQAAGAPTGSGTLRRYQVEVEEGIDLSAEQAAEEIEKIIAHPRGWAAHGRGRFQLVSSDADFVIRIATPTTADRLCAAEGLDTRGELNCETIDGVVVNLRRWMLGSPTFDGPPAEYRHLIINHEVGHEIGIRRHMGCPGDGKPAPVMMQQIKGLNGCVSNAWPYDQNGTFLTGPLV
ncbi:DUF3152 domain-containing protein [Streptomyces sp. NPDC002889]|uniref:DUF3152 domain-containing protein n=1 Tax=Streptomyces sp. NPDC002889 TaxID=3364669 RepID=UPI0036AC0DA1